LQEPRFEWNRIHRSRLKAASAAALRFQWWCFWGIYFTEPAAALLTGGAHCMSGARSIAFFAIEWGQDAFWILR
jgi:hypothetical protein